MAMGGGIVTVTGGGTVTVMGGGILMLICAMEATGVANAANMDKDEITNRKRRMLIPPSPSLAFVPTQSRRNDATLRHNRACGGGSTKIVINDLDLRPSEFLQAIMRRSQLIPISTR